MTHTYVDIQVRPIFVDGIRHNRIRRHGQQKRSKKKISFSVIFFVCIFAIIILFSFASQIRAAEATLTPHTCLGGWNNPSNASGLPDITDGDPTKYSDINSASISNTLADIFCGDFSGDIPKDTKPTAITLKFSWALLPKIVQPEISATAEDLASSTNSILDATPESIGTSLDASSTDETTPTSSESAPPQAVPDSTVPGDVPSPDSPQSSLIQNIFASILPHKVYAETLETDATSTIDFIIKSETASTTNSTSSAQISTSTQITEDALLEVSYTLDGITWNTLGTVTRSNLTLSSFVIPIDSAPEWSDVARMQIRVRSLSTVSDNGVLYLDGMSLVVEYEKSSQEVKDQKTEEETQDFLSKLPDIDLTISPISNSGSIFEASLITMGDGKNGIRFSDTNGGNIFVYKGLNHSLFMNSGMGIEPVDMPLYLFPPDTYTVLDISNADECDQTATIDDCRTAPSFKGETVFSVSIASSSAISSSDVITNQ